MTIENIPNSFVRFNEPDTVANFRREVQIAYPVFEVDDFHFVFRITGTAFDMNAFVTDPTQLRLGFTLDKSTLIRDWFAIDGLTPVINQVSPTELTVAWPYGMPGLTSSINMNQCFYVGLRYFFGVPGVLMGSSNMFKRIGTNKLTVVLEYWSKDDAYGFPYCALEPFHNRARIPAYLGAPQFTSKEDVYRKSNGELVSLSAYVGKQYLMRTGHLPEEIHWPINVALNHENIRVTDDRYDMLVKKNGQYDVAWPDQFEPILAPGLVKLDQSGIPDSSGAGCGCVDFVNCTDYDFIAMEAGVGNTHQIEVETSCTPEELLYAVTYDLIPGTTTVSPTGFVSVVPPGGTYLPSLTLLSTVTVTCGDSSCEMNFYSIVF